MSALSTHISPTTQMSYLSFSSTTTFAHTEKPAHLCYKYTVISFDLLPNTKHLFLPYTVLCHGDCINFLSLPPPPSLKQDCQHTSTGSNKYYQRTHLPLPHTSFVIVLSPYFSLTSTTSYHNSTTDRHTSFYRPPYMTRIYLLCKHVLHQGNTSTSVL